jgi:hypothetical protein
VLVAETRDQVGYSDSNEKDTDSTQDVKGIHAWFLLAFHRADGRRYVRAGPVQSAA